MSIGEKQGWRPARRSSQYVRPLAEVSELRVEREKRGWVWRHMIGQRCTWTSGGYYDSARAAQAAADEWWETQ